jgi:hypothetical protein
VLAKMKELGEYGMLTYCLVDSEIDDRRSMNSELGCWMGMRDGKEGNQAAVLLMYGWCSSQTSTPISGSRILCDRR